MRRAQRDNILVLISEDESEWALTAFELALGEAILAGSDPRLKAARAQFRRARAMKRELTGHGFYVDLYIPDDAPLADTTLIATPLGDAWITGADLSEGAHAMMSAERGRLLAIEACAAGGPLDGPTWPHGSAERYLLDNEPTATITDADGRAWFENGRSLPDG
jgi:hypothetical protein